ncbi:hypothetical protein ABZ471_33980 [Streptomyces sp. NPDC005728]|uniref:hypothetical protein n=1 Tax=Streptomyces sp. NPDC005728 TaxID=3157054 RepID=UPI0033E1D64B
MSLLLAAGFDRAEAIPLSIAPENLVPGSALDPAAPETMRELTDRARNHEYAHS